MTLRITIPAALALALVASGCGVQDPYNDERPARQQQQAQTTPTPTPSATATAGADQRMSGQAPTPDDATEEGAGAQPPPDAALPGRPDAAAVEAAIRRFGTRYVNWDWDSMAQTRRDLASMATGQLHEQLMQDATEIQTESQRRPSNQANSGTVEGIIAQKDKPIFVVTRETGTFGTEAARQRGYFLYVANVEQVDGAWKLSDWRAVTA